VDLDRIVQQNDATLAVMARQTDLLQYIAETYERLDAGSRHGPVSPVP
jgi:hypothetical protein